MKNNGTSAGVFKPSAVSAKFYGFIGDFWIFNGFGKIQTVSGKVSGVHRGLQKSLNKLL